MSVYNNRSRHYFNNSHNISSNHHHNNNNSNNNSFNSRKEKDLRPRVILAQNLPSNVTVQSLTKFIRQITPPHFHLTSCDVLSWEKGKQVGFIEFGNPDDTIEALNLIHGFPINGSTIEASFHPEPTPDVLVEIEQGKQRKQRRNNQNGQSQTMQSNVAMEINRSESSYQSKAPRQGVFIPHGGFNQQQYRNQQHNHLVSRSYLVSPVSDDGDNQSSVSSFRGQQPQQPQSSNIWGSPTNAGFNGFLRSPDTPPYYANGTFKPSSAPTYGYHQQPIHQDLNNNNNNENYYFSHQSNKSGQYNLW